MANSSGNLTSSASYDSFGNATGNLNTRYQFTGREYDSFSKLHYYRARFYDGKLGRFISEDPIGFAGGDVNLYGYVWNSPQSFTDPMGLDGWGNDTADWIDEKLNVAEEFYGFDPTIGLPHQQNGLFSTLRGMGDMLRVGNGLGYAIYCDDNIYGKAAYIAMDVKRASDIFTTLAGPFAGKTGGSRGAGSPCLRCFEEETEVQTEDGLKPIEKIEAGDKVLSYNETTGFLEYQEVLQKMSRYADDIYSVKIEGESKPLGVTGEHPFFVRVYHARDNLLSGDDDGEWRETQHLQIGDEIKLANGSWAKVLEVKFKGEGQVYNFTVANNHNYFVGNLRLLTHNAANCQGPFSVTDWTGYPDANPPTSPFELLDGQVYANARSAANSANRGLHRSSTYDGLDIHEIHPVKFGGSPTDIANKVGLTRAQHTPYTTFWNRLQRSLEGR